MVNQASDPLKDLKDIQLPIEPGLWPLAPGWWLLMLAIIASIALVVYFYFKRKNSLKTHAYKEWQGYVDLPARDQLIKTRGLIRRIAQQQFAISVGDNSQQKWQQFLLDQQLERIFEQQQSLWSKQSVNAEYVADCYQKTGQWIRRLK